MLAIFGQAGQRYRSAPEERFQVYQATEKAEVNRDQETHEQQQYSFAKNMRALSSDSVTLRYHILVITILKKAYDILV